jgi:concanavalin A-like lectin/glucanase superfamily protein/putative zinc finger protein
VIPPHDSARREHDDFRLLAAAAVDGRIDPDSAKALERHLTACPECRADQKAMFEDHVWLATPRRIDPPSSQVREYVLEAARSHRIPRTSNAARPWAAFAAAGFVIAVIGGGLLLAAGYVPSSGAVASMTPDPERSSTASSSPLVPRAACVPRPPEITSHWRLDGDGLDDVGDADLTLLGDGSFGEGVVQDGQALDLARGWGEVADDRQIRVRSGDFTVLLWVRFDDLTGEQTLIEQWREGPTTEDFRGWTLTKLVGNEILITTGGPTGSGGALSDVLEIRPGWHHVAARRAGDAMSLFFDGELVAEGAMTLPGVDLRVDTPLLVGRRGDENGYFVRGQIDDVMLAVGGSLSDDEIAGIFHAAWAGTC